MVLSGWATTMGENQFPDVALQLASLWRGTLMGCCQLLTLPMGGTSPLDHLTRQFESGMLRLALQSESLLMTSLTLWHPLHTLPMRSISFLGPAMELFTYQTHFHKFLLNLLRPSRLNGQIKRVGSQMTRAAWYIGYPMIVGQASIHLLSSQSLSHLLFSQFLSNLGSLYLEPLGPKFLILHVPSLSLFLTPRL